MKTLNCSDCGRNITPSLKQQQNGTDPKRCNACIRMKKIEKTVDKIWRKLNATQG